MGFSSVTGDETIMFADNASFDGTQRGGKMITNGQLWVGATSSPHVKLGGITSPLGTLTIGYSSPNITLDIPGGGFTVQHLTADTGGQLNPTANNFTLAGSGSIATSGSGSTITTALTGLTNHNVLLGAGTSTITKLAPSATSGVALVSQGAAADPAFATVAIAGGGTNATSFTQSNGIVTYNGTSLVNYAGPQIDSSGRYTNTTQPAFLAYLATTATNKTGAGTSYQLGTDALTEVFDQGSNFNTNGTFTAPVTGKYALNTSSIITGCTVAVGQTTTVITSNRSYLSQFNRPAIASNLCAPLSVLADMDSADTAVVTVMSSGEVGDTDDILGDTILYTYFSGALSV